MTHHVVRVTESSQPSAARYLAREFADRAGFGEEDSYRAGLVATELATNLVKHARGGEILVREIGSGAPGEIEILAVDRGPGIGNLARALEDGRSTTGTSGTGLGAVRRLSDDFDMHSSMPNGTVVLARVRAGRARAADRPAFSVEGVSVAKQGEIECGDAWVVCHRPDAALVLLADGLGHGPAAARAADAAVQAIRAHLYPDCASALSAVHEGLRHTRGASAAVLELNARAHVMRFAGVGNVGATVLVNGSARQAVSHNGTLGHQARHFREYSYPWDPKALLVMYSDGLISHWSLDAYPGLKLRHPAIVAAVLYRDFTRGRDDVTVIVAREQP
jgi:anti-sigma regulatory factor (Ser/Thr protein kinase)